MISGKTSCVSLGRLVYMKVEKIATKALNFSHAGYEKDVQTNDTRDVISDDSRIESKMDDTMKYLNALSEEHKCDITVKLDYNDKTKKGEITGEIKDKEGKKPTRHVRVPINSENDNSVINHINQFRNNCATIIRA